MLPFVEIPALDLGPLSIQPFGVLTATGVLVGTSMAARYAARYRLDDDTLRFIGMRVIVLGFIMCHLFDVFLYTPSKVLTDPWVILRVWEGLASYGGILGATLAFTIYSRVRKFHYLRYGDAVVYGFSIGILFGRLGCSTAHDHLGRQTDFFLGVLLPKLNRCKDCVNWRLPDGTAEVTAHDLGAYEVFLWAFIFLVLNLVMVYWKKRRPGTMLWLTAFMYAPVRFMFEFLRFPETDPRYLGLTPAQHLAIWTVVGGIAVLVAQRKPENQELFEAGPMKADAAEDDSGKGDKSGSKSKSKSAQSRPKAAKPKPKAKIVRMKKRK